jgi:hypothetical protein
MIMMIMGLIFHQIAIAKKTYKHDSLHSCYFIGFIGCITNAIPSDNSDQIFSSHQTSKQFAHKIVDFSFHGANVGPHEYKDLLEAVGKVVSN